MLRLVDLDIGYRSRRGQATIVQAGLNARAEPGRLIGLVGPNGAGKSTLLRTMAGLQSALSGEVLLDGDPVSQLSPVQVARKVAVVLTDRVEAGRLRVEELVGLGRHPYTGWNGRLSVHDHRIVNQCLDETGAGALVNRCISELSDGQRQRVMIARALAQEPAVLLLDEPTSFLDPPSRTKVFELTHRLAQLRALTVVICTHDIECASRYCDALWLVSSTAPMRIGAPEDLAVSGDLSAAFGGANFDLASLTFGSDTVAMPLAKVVGDGPRGHGARHCLRRAGYTVESRFSPDQKPSLVVSCDKDSWSIIWPTRSTHPTLAALHDAAVSARMNS